MEETNIITKKPEALLTPTLAWFMGAMILANIAGSMYGNILPLYLTSMKATPEQVGLYFKVFSFIPLALQILGGWISDSLGRLKSIAFGSAAGVLSYVGLILAPTWQWVLLGEGLGAVTRSLVGPSFSAFIAEESSEKNRARTYGITETVFGIVTVIGPPLGGFLVDTLGFKKMLMIAAMIYTAATIIRIFMARRAASHEQKTSTGKLSFTTLKKNLGTVFILIMAGGLIMWMMVTDGIRDISFSLSFSFLPVYLDEVGRMSATQVGWLMSIFGVANMLVTFPAGWLADKKGERLAIGLGFLIQFAALLLFVNLQGFWGYAMVWALFGMGVGLQSPAYQSLISKALPGKLRGTGFGLMHSSLGLFSLPAPYIGGKIYTHVSPRAPFIITAFASLLAIIPVWFRFKITTKEKQIAEEFNNGGDAPPIPENAPEENSN